MKQQIKIGSVLFSIFKYVMLIAAAVISLLPVVVCVFTAFKTTEDYNSSSVLDMPKQWMAENFSIALDQANMLRGGADMLYLYQRHACLRTEQI